MAEAIKSGIEISKVCPDGGHYYWSLWITAWIRNPQGC